MEKQFFILLALIFSTFTIAAQGHHKASKQHGADFKHFRIAALIGHTSIPSGENPEHVFIPSWGFDFEYWFDDMWGVGSHNDIEVEAFIVRSEGGEELEREYPIVTTVELLIKPWKGIVLQIGPGMEFEKEKNYNLIRYGLEYEFELTKHWDIAPTFFYDSRFNAFDTWSIALGVGKRF